MAPKYPEGTKVKITIPRNRGLASSELIKYDGQVGVVVGIKTVIAYSVAKKGETNGPLYGFPSSICIYSVALEGGLTLGNLDEYLLELIS